MIQAKFSSSDVNSLAIPFKTLVCGATSQFFLCVFNLPYLPECKTTPRFPVASVGFFKVYFVHEFIGSNFIINCCSRTSKIASLLTFTGK
jgi:hypothetical protein